MHCVLVLMLALLVCVSAWSRHDKFAMRERVRGMVVRRLDVMSQAIDCACMYGTLYVRMYVCVRRVRMPLPMCNGVYI
jgi:hypothetical protein